MIFTVVIINNHKQSDGDGLGKRRRMESKGPIGSTLKYPLVVILVVCAISVIFSYFTIRANIEFLGIGTAIRHTNEAQRYIMLLTIILSQCILLLASIPLAMILGGNSGARKTRRERLTYKATQGIDYLRETFTDINPATASLLMDLQIDYKKDINATLLRMYHKGSVDISGDNITLLNHTLCTEPCEAELFHILRNGRITGQAMWQWGENRKREAVQRGLLQHKKSRGIKGCCIGCCISAFILFAIVFILPGIIAATAHGFMANGRYEESFENIVRRLESIQGMADSLDTAIELLERTFLQGNSLTIEELQEMNRLFRGPIITFMLLILIFFAIPYMFTRSLSYQTSTDGLARTKEGHRRTEEVAALKRFIRDFGNFSMSEKEHVVLWEDFLVFAIVLEENTSIVKDIGRISKNGIRDMEFVSVAENQYEAGMETF